MRKPPKMKGPKRLWSLETNMLSSAKAPFDPEIVATWRYDVGNAMAAVAVSVSRLIWREIQFHFATREARRNSSTQDFRRHRKMCVRKCWSWWILLGFWSLSWSQRASNCRNEFIRLCHSQRQKRGHLPVMQSSLAWIFLDTPVQGFNEFFCSSQSSEYNLRNWTMRIVLLWLLFWHLQHTMGEFGSHGDQVQCSRPTMGSMASGPMWRSNWPRSIARLSAKGRRSSGAVSIVSNKLEFLQLYVTRMWMCFRCQGLAIWRFQSSFKTENCFGRKLKPVVFHIWRKFSVFLETFRPTSFMSMLLGEIGSWMYSVFFTKNDTLV